MKPELRVLVPLTDGGSPAPSQTTPHSILTPPLPPLCVFLHQNQTAANKRAFFCL